MAVNFLELIAGTSVDLKGLDEGLKKAEGLAEESARKIGGHFNLIGVSIVTAIAGAALTAIGEAVKKTAEWGEQLEHLSNRMGMTVTQTATVVGVMERFGVNTQMGARALQILSMQVQATQNSMDPLSTRLGRVLGSLRDTNGAALNMSQVLDLVRQKVSAASSDSEKLQIATTLLGSRIGGQLVPMLRLSNAEWEKQKASVESTLGPVEEAAHQAIQYKQATAELNQIFKEFEITLGTKILPELTAGIRTMNEWLKVIGSTKETKAATEEIDRFHGRIGSATGAINEAIYAYKVYQELLGKAPKGSAELWHEHIDAGNTMKDTIADAAEEEENLNKEIQQTIQNERRVVAEVKEHVSLMEKARQLGIGGGNERLELEEALNKLTGQRLLLERKMAETTLSPDQREKYETDLLKNRVDAAQLVTDYTLKGYKEEELQIKANGAFNLTNEIQLLQKKLNDEHIVGDERLQIEAEIYQKRQQFVEESIKLGRQLGFVSADQEIAYRKQRSAQLLGQGDALGAGQELAKARDLAIKQADQVMEFTKKIRIVAIQDEIEYQTRKLEVVKGNAEEEMKILSQIADLDKQLYDRRLTFALNYNQSAIDSYKAMLKATGQSDTNIHGKGESLTFAERDREAEYARFQNAKLIEQVAQHGGTDEEIAQARSVSEQNRKDMEEAMTLGKSVSDGMKAIADSAKDFFKAASGGEEVRAPGGPSPVIGSLLSPAEGLSTETLARGSDIPRLDTSFTDLAVRIRDVLNGTIAPLQNFANQITLLSKQIGQVTGSGYNPGIIGPAGGVTNVPAGTPPPTGYGQVAGSPVTYPTAGPPGTTQPPTVTPQPGVTSVTAQQNPDISRLVEALDGLPDKLLTTLQSQQAANSESLQAALNQVLASRQAQGVEVKVTVDQNTGDLLANYFVQQISSP